MHDVFISYGSRDRAWAERLEQDLGRKGFQIFLDRKRLVPGTRWEPELTRAVRASKHLVVLWSSHAKQSDWVWKELSSFESACEAEGDSGRRLVFVNLDETNQAYASWQKIDDLREAGAYASGVDGVGEALWRQVMEKLASAFRDDADAIPIPVVVLTLTRRELEELNPAQIERFAQPLALSPAQLLARYGATRRDWKPLGSDKPILEILEDLRDGLNSAQTGIRFRWEQPPDAFWSSIEEADRFANAFLASRLSLLVVDPVAVGVSHVYKRLMHFQRCLQSKGAAIVVLPPFAPDQRLRALRELVRENGSPYFNPYYRPSLPPDTRLAAHCGFGIADVEDMQRLLRMTVGQYLAERGPREQSSYLSMR